MLFVRRCVYWVVAPGYSLPIARHVVVSHARFVTQQQQPPVNVYLLPTSEQVGDEPPGDDLYKNDLAAQTH